MVNIPPTYLEFKSQKGKNYSITHVPEHPKGPFINLCGLHKNRTDFIDVARDVLKITCGGPEGWDRGGLYWNLETAILKGLLLAETSLSDRLLGNSLNITEREKDLITSIEIRPGFTERALYNCVIGYKSCFKELRLDEKLREIVETCERYDDRRFEMKVLQ